MFSNIVNECYQITANTEDHSADSLRKAFTAYFGKRFFNQTRKNLIRDKSSFVELYNMFDAAQSKLFDLADCQGDEQFRSLVNSLMINGVVKVEGLIPSEMIGYGNLVLERLSELLPPKDRQRAGYIIPHVGQTIRHFPSDVNDGQLRAQSKTWGRHSAGSRDMVQLPGMLNIFTAYNSLNTFDLNRSTMEWIFPSEINHNGWHRDMAVHRVKAMVLLSDCHVYSAPFLYAKKSHRMETDFDKEHLFDRFCLPATARYGMPETWTSGRTSWPEYALKKHGKQCGYINSSHAPNDMTASEREQETVVISDTEYDLFVGTGKPGDVIFFDSCGLHSGSRALIETRRNITFSSINTLSPKNIFFNLIQNMV